jgi:hypothetical protein
VAEMIKQGQIVPSEVGLCKLKSGDR